MDSFNHCVQCNPEKNWLELEFMSENDEPIDGLAVTITNKITSNTHTQTTSAGKVLFANIAAGEWRASVSQASLLSEVEKYASRKEGQESPVKTRASAEFDAAEQNPKRYHSTTIGDFWDEAPQDEFLQEHHKGIDTNASAEKAGFSLSHNQSYVFEIKALRSYMPVIIDTDEFSLVNSYTFALLSKLAYATDEANLDDKVTSANEGSIKAVIWALKQKIKPTHAADASVNWLVEEIPYSQALDFTYYAQKEVGAEGYILFNHNTAIVGVRGTEPYISNGEPSNSGSTWEIVKNIDGFGAVVNAIPAVQKITDSSLIKDMVGTNIDAAQVSIKEFGGAYVHQGFYRYAMTLWMGNEDSSLSRDVRSIHHNKNFYICGHSLGGAGALMISAILKEMFSPSVLRLFTYGAPRSGTRSFSERYKSITHYRHVNNHDLVPQVPWKWVNTADTEDNLYVAILKMFHVRGAKTVEKIFETTDGDDDNYHHHGELTQLLTYEKPSEQVLLSPRQTHMPILDAISAVDNDSFPLLDKINNNVSLSEQVNDHGMVEYIPNLAKLLHLLLHVPLKEHYLQAINFLDEQQKTLSNELMDVKNQQAEMSGTWQYSDVNKAKNLYLKRKQTLTKNMLTTYRQIKFELLKIMNDPQLMPTEKLLVANKSLPDFIKEQI